MTDVIGEVKSILAEVTPLAARYYRLTGKPLGVTGEVAEYVAAEALGLDLAPPRTPGYDATRTLADGTRQRIQIKGRAFEGKTIKGRMGRIEKDCACDVVLLVLLDSATLEPCQMWEAPYPAIAARLAEPGSIARNQRGALAVADFIGRATRVWPTSAGEAEI